MDEKKEEFINKFGNSEYLIADGKGGSRPTGKFITGVPAKDVWNHVQQLLAQQREAMVRDLEVMGLIGQQLAIAFQRGDIENIKKNTDLRFKLISKYKLNNEK